MERGDRTAIERWLSVAMHVRLERAFRENVEQCGRGLLMESERLETTFLLFVKPRTKTAQFRRAR